MNLDKKVKQQGTQRGKAATVAARATAEYAEYAEAGRETLSIPFQRIRRIPRFDRCGSCCPDPILRGRQANWAIALQRTQRAPCISGFKCAVLTGKNAVSRRFPSLRSLRSLRFMNCRFQVEHLDSVRRVRISRIRVPFFIRQSDCNPATPRTASVFSAFRRMDFRDGASIRPGAAIAPGRSRGKSRQ